MKRGTPDHPKVDHLMELLSVPRYAAVGILESLWHVAQRYAPRGDIGKFPNARIARKIGYNEKEAESLVKALVMSGWLDVSSKYRLVVHDWQDHVDQTVKRYLDTHRTTFCYDDASIMPASCYDETSQPVPVPVPVPEPVPEPTNGEFDVFWSLYPRKVGKGTGRRAWASAVKKAAPRTITAGLKRSVAHWQDDKTEMRYIPHPSAWLNGERWSDDILGDGTDGKVFTSTGLGARCTIYPGLTKQQTADGFVRVIRDDTFRTLSAAEVAAARADADIWPEVERQIGREV